MKPLLRPATHDDLDAIYLMGFDAWADGSSEDDYLNGCRSSSKYKRGNWFVLEANGILLSSLIVYKFNTNAFGIGSIATPEALRKRGYASKLIIETIQYLELEKDAQSIDIFLYSDIDPEFYERFGFRRLPTSAQRYQSTVCMLRGTAPEKFNNTDNVPEYF